MKRRKVLQRIAPGSSIKKLFERIYFFSLVAIFLFPAGAEAQNCGGENQNACDVATQLWHGIGPCKRGLIEYFGDGWIIGKCYRPDRDRFPSWCGDAGEEPCKYLAQKAFGVSACKRNYVDYWGKCNPIDREGFPNWCGREGEKACVIGTQTFFGIRACKSGLTDYLGTCYRVDSEGFPDYCGHAGQEACKLAAQATFGIYACKNGLTDYLGTCYRVDREGFPDYCGHEGQEACKLAAQASFGIYACKDGLTDYLGTCYSWDSDGFPDFCGRNGQATCSPAAMAHFQIAACKPNLAWDGAKCRKNLCGQNGQRPCWLYERIPSCDPGLKEDFENGVCVPLGPGESAFFEGLSSLTKTYSEGVVPACKEVLSLVPVGVEQSTQIGLAASCTKYMLIGAGCAMLAKAANADNVGTANNWLFEPMAKAYSEGTVQSIGNEWAQNVGEHQAMLVNTAYSAYRALDYNSLQCAVEMLQSGDFGGELDFSKANPEVCMTIGELALTLHKLRKTFKGKPEKQTQTDKEETEDFINKIKNSPTVKKGQEIKKKAKAVKKTGEKGYQLSDQLQLLQHCVEGKEKIERSRPQVSSTQTWTGETQRSRQPAPASQAGRGTISRTAPPGARFPETRPFKRTPSYSGAEPKEPDTAVTIDIGLGMTEDQIMQALGKPEKILNLGATKIYVYEDIKVTFVDGEATDIQ